MEQVGITQTAPRGLPIKPPISLSIPIGPIISVHELPIGQAGGAPISVNVEINHTKSFHP